MQAPTSDPGTTGDQPPSAVNRWTFSIRTRRPSLLAIFAPWLVSPRAHDASVLLATWAHSPHKGDYAATPHYQRGFVEQNHAVMQLAREMRIPCFDFASSMPTSPELWRDGRHVNARGAKIQAQLLARYLIENSLLPKAESPSPKTHPDSLLTN